MTWKEALDNYLTEAPEEHMESNCDYCSVGIHEDEINNYEGKILCDSCLKNEKLLER